MANLSVITAFAAFATVVDASVALGLQDSQEARWFLSAERVIRESGKAPLTRILSMASGPNGNLYVGDLYGIQVFTKRGDHVRQIGRRASTHSPGPGEFVTLVNIGFMGDTLWVADNAVGRISLFTTDGDLIDTWSVVERLPPSERGMPFKPLGVLSANHIAVVEYSEDLNMRQYGSGAAELLILDRGGDTVARLPELDPTHAYMSEFEPPSVHLKRRQPFAFSDMVGVDPFSDKLIVVERPVPSGSPAFYSIHGFGGDGSERFRSLREYSPSEMSDDDVEAWIDNLLSKYPGGLLPPRIRRKVYQRGLYRPGYYPPIPNDVLGVFRGPFAFGQDGSVWVKRALPENEDSALWDVFTDAGILKGTASAPADAQLYLITGMRAWGVTYNDLNVPRIVSYVIKDSP